MSKISRHAPCQRLKCSVLFVALLLHSFAAFASQDCGAGIAAQKAAEAAINAEIEQINKEAEDSFSTSDSIGKCLGELSTSIRIPTFPSISDILNKVKEQACQIARQKIAEKISSKIPATIDPWGTLSQKYLPADIQQYLPNTSGKDVQINAGSDGLNSNMGTTKESEAFPFHL